MDIRSLTRWRTLAAVLAVAVVGGITATAQAPRPPESDVLAALLTEVRALRVAMEQMASAGPRVQLALGRLQLQEQRVNTTIRRLESVRDAIASTTRELATAQAQAEAMEKMFKDAAGSEDAGPMKEMVAQFQRQAATLRDALQPLLNEEAVLQQQIADEQARWTDINRSLEELERSLGKR